MNLHGSQITLRPIGMKDADSIAKNITEDIARYMDNMPYPYDRSDAVSFIKDTQAKMKKGEVLRLGIEKGESKKIIGMIGFESINLKSKNAEIGYWLGKTYWGSGIMTEAVTMMTAHGFKTLKLRRVYARVFEPNVGSAKVLQRVGYKKEGQLREHVKVGRVYVDEMRFGLLKSEYDA